MTASGGWYQIHFWLRPDNEMPLGDPIQWLRWFRSDGIGLIDELVIRHGPNLDNLISFAPEADG